MKISLNRKQKQVTAIELRQNYELLGRAEEEVLADLRFSRAQLTAALHVTGAANGHGVWKPRDAGTEVNPPAGGTTETE